MLFAPKEKGTSLVEYAMLITLALIILILLYAALSPWIDPIIQKLFPH